MRNGNLTFHGAGYATCFCGTGDTRRPVVGDNLEDEWPACLSLVWLKGSQVEGQQAIW